MDKTLTLVEACKIGNRQAQFDLYHLYAKAMYNTGLRIVKDKTDAEDVLQEAFIEAFTKLDSFRAEASFGSWLKVIVINKALAKLKLNKIIFEDVTNLNIMDEEIEINDNQEMITRIKESLLKLADGFRVIISMYLFEGFDHQEIAQILNIKESTSRSQYLRGKQKLIQILRNEN